MGPVFQLRLIRLLKPPWFVVLIWEGATYWGWFLQREDEPWATGKWEKPDMLIGKVKAGRPNAD